MRHYLEHPLWAWAAFNALIVAMLLLDLSMIRREGWAVGVREALGWSLFWIVLALAFGAGVWRLCGSTSAMEFLASYLIEKSLSVDNLFVFWMIFSRFSVPDEHQHKVLFLGILGALVLRAVFILAGTALLASFHWVSVVFGGFLMLSGIRMAAGPAAMAGGPDSPLVRLLRRWLPMSERLEGGRFFVRSGGRWLATPLLAVLLAVETTDIVFAADSVPAVLAVSRDPFIVYTSNALAVLGLRALYLVLAGAVRRLRYLGPGLCVILVFVGAKMIVSEWVHVPVALVLGFVALCLAASVAASLLRPGEVLP